ncbi:hypothetical protein F0562_026390 [Nyssa sinensis]|uniref:Uncharacterized protein n=1 Tax=Nyssa sinensis TaxID=561372 RepID=A0A5J5BAS1_9ASTE|nr:hypothetical protein F0562_026390 [Nyssa sinensis]
MLVALLRFPSCVPFPACAGSALDLRKPQLHEGKMNPLRRKHKPCSSPQPRLFFNPFHLIDALNFAIVIQLRHTDSIVGHNCYLYPRIADSFDHCSSDRPRLDLRSSSLSVTYDLRILQFQSDPNNEGTSFNHRCTY